MELFNIDFLLYPLQYAPQHFLLEEASGFGSSCRSYDLIVSLLRISLFHS